MPKIAAIRPLCYNLGHVGSLGDVVAPSGFADSETVDRRYKRHPAHIIRLMQNREEPGDREGDALTRAARFLKRWESEGVLHRETHPAVYRYDQLFSLAGQSFHRKSLLCGLHLEPSGASESVFAYHAPSPEIVAAEVQRLQTVRAGIAPLVVAYSGDHDTLELLDQHIPDGQTLSLVDDLGVEHRISPVTDSKAITELNQRIGRSASVILSGTTAYRGSQQILDATRHFGVGSPDAELALAMLVPATDPTLLFEPLRVEFHVKHDVDSVDFEEHLARLFDLTKGQDFAGESRWDSDSSILLRLDQRAEWIGLTPNSAGQAQIEQDGMSSNSINLPICLVDDLLLKHALAGMIVEPGDPKGDATQPVEVVVQPPTLSEIEALVAGDSSLSREATLLHPPLAGLAIHTIS